MPIVKKVDFTAGNKINLLEFAADAEDLGACSDATDIHVNDQLVAEALLALRKKRVKLNQEVLEATFDKLGLHLRWDHFVHDEVLYHEVKVELHCVLNSEKKLCLKRQREFDFII
jgi:hypothetical protein